MANPRFNPLYSSDEIWLGNQTNRCLTDELDNIYTSLDITIPETYAVKNHVHEQYATVDGLNAKADAEHNHDDVYYKKSEVDEMFATFKIEVAEMIEKAIASKANANDTTEEVAKDTKSGASESSEPSNGEKQTAENETVS